MTPSERLRLFLEIKNTEDGFSKVAERLNTAWAVKLGIVTKKECFKKEKAACASS